MTGKGGSYHVTPAVPGQLAVEVSLPAPGWWNGDTPATINGGYEYCMGAIIAYRLGLPEMQVVNVSWAQLIGGNTKNFALA
jgi:polar amino acid transport system substrate-binding protein